MVEIVFKDCGKCNRFYKSEKFFPFFDCELKMYLHFQPEKRSA